MENVGPFPSSKPPKRANARLLRCLKEQGRSTVWFCTRMGVNRSTVWRIEQGILAAPADWYERAARVLGVDVAEIEPESGKAEAAA